MHRGVGHHCGARGDGVPDAPHPHDVVVVGFAEEIPDARRRRDDVRLIAAVGDDIVRPLLYPQVLAAVVPRDVHQLDRVERAAAAPRIDGAMRRLALEEILDRHQTVAAAVAPAGRQTAADMAVQNDIDVVEHPRPYVVRLAAELLLGNAGPDQQGARDALPFHDVLHREHRGDVHRLTRVVALTVSRSTLDQRLAIRDPRHLRRLRDAIDVAAERDHRAARSPPRDPAARDARHPQLDLESLPFEDAGDVALGFELLEPELAEAEQAVDHLLDEDAAAVDVAAHLVLETLEPRVDLGLRRRPVPWRGPDRSDDECGDDGGGRLHESGSHGGPPPAAVRCARLRPSSLTATTGARG